MTRFLLATRNQHKLAELQRILDAALGTEAVELVGLADVADYPETPETGLTFVDNALLKAHDGVLHTGLPTIADDSGLAVDAFNGMPGVFSARWSGRHGDDRANLDLLLAQLSDVDDPHRTARFVCAAVLVLPGDGPDATRREFTATGELLGHLVRAPRGSNGFGYDPIFVAEGNTVTNGELTSAEKDTISHRGKALRVLAGTIRSQVS